jgi:peptide/nickel transport system substrate-binding protein
MNVPRTFRPRWGARILATLALGLLLTGAPTALAGKPHAAPTPKSGGNFTFRDIATPDCLDVAKTAVSTSTLIDTPAIDTLISVNAKGKLIPYLATKWVVAKNGKTITFLLRHNVKFSNGHPFTSADVKAAFDRYLDPATKSPYSASLLAGVTSTTTAGKYTVRLHLKAPNRPLLTYLTNVYLSIPDRKSVSAAGSNTCNGLVGTGAFKISNVAAGYSTITEVRNPLHTFGPSWAFNKGPAHLSSITFVPVSSNTTAVSELLAGQLDMTDVAGSELNRVQGNSNYKLYRIGGESEVYLAFNCGRAPFNNVAVRRAVAQAIDCKALVTAALQGLGKPSTSLVPPGVFGYDPASATYAPKLNLNAARSAIAAAHATGPYGILTIAVLGGAAGAELIQGQLAQVGMQTTVDTKSVSDWVAALEKGDFDMALIFHGSGPPPGDADFLYSLLDSSQRNGGLDFLGLTDKTLDKLVEDGRTNLNLKQARADYQKAQKIVVGTKVYADPLWLPVTVYAARSRVQDVHFDVGGDILWQDLWVK